MDSGFASESGKYDAVGDRVPGNLTNYIAAQSTFVDVLGIVETSAWVEEVRLEEERRLGGGLERSDE